MKIVFQPAPYTTAESPESLVFVEVEDDQGKSINAGTWSTRDEYSVLTIDVEAHINSLKGFPLELDHRNELEQLLASQASPRAWQRLTPEEVVVLDAYRRNRPALIAGESVHLLLAVDSNHRSTLVQCEPKEAIPPNVYYRDGNFYSYPERHGMGEAFYYRWKDRAGEFPSEPMLTTAAREAKPKTIMGSDGRDHPWP